MSEPNYQVRVETVFSASHQLRGYKAEVEPLHGHNFRVEATVTAKELDELGLVVDFLMLESWLKEIVAPYDHQHVNDVAPFGEMNPSTENMARFFFEELEEKLERPGVALLRVRVWEAPTFCASYGRD